MKDETSQFMLEEYTQIANAYQDLHAQQNELVKFYLTIVALPTSIIGVLLQINLKDVTTLPTVVTTNLDLGILLLKILIIALVFIGFAVFCALIANRSEAILYVKTVNCIRRFFIDNDDSILLDRYLVLSDNDKTPGFWEGISSRSFWNIAIVALLNSGIFSLTIYALFLQSRTNPNIERNLFLLSLVWFFIQELIHWAYLSIKDKEYIPKFSYAKKEIKIGIDLDGVLGDLAREVIKIAKERFNKKINFESITTYDLSQCTTLTPEEIAIIFKETNIFNSMKAFDFSSELCKLISNKEWIIHIVTDRFWSNHDWEISHNWLVNNKIIHNQLVLIKSNEKMVYAQENKLDYFIEDRLETAIEVSAVCNRVFLIDAPYNQGQVNEKVFRVRNLQEIKYYLSL